MAFDGIVTRAAAKELRDILLLGRIDKIYQPEKEELVINIHTGNHGNVKLFASTASAGSRIGLIDWSPLNPPNPSGFCMLMRKHLQGGRIVDISQKGCERIIEFKIETLNEMGFSVNRNLIFEIMGRHSNIILVDMDDGKITDSIKRVSIDTSRVRPVLPGKTYEYPPEQKKIPFDKVTDKDLEDIPKNRKGYLAAIGGISPAAASEIALSPSPEKRIAKVLDAIENGNTSPHIYKDDTGKLQEYHVMNLSEYENITEILSFDTLSECLTVFYENREETNRIRQRGNQLRKNINQKIDKLRLKLQRLFEDRNQAENSDRYRLFGELLTANLHMVNQGEKEITVTNYYDGEQITIPLDPKFTPAKNAQKYYKKYGKAMTAIKEKAIQIEETEKEIQYLESVLTFLENTDKAENVDAIREELVESGYIRRSRKQQHKKKKYKADPYVYTTSTGKTVYAGRNNKENDQLTMKRADNRDMWFHTKDIPGSHIILQLRGQEPEETDILEAAAIAAFHSKGRSSENVPVDYTYVKYVKKPNGAKPGMVIFTDNSTIWVDPALPEKSNFPK